MCFVLWAGREVKLVGIATAAAIPCGQRPQTINADWLAIAAAQLAE